MDERGNPSDAASVFSGALANERVREMLARFRAEGPSVLREFAGDPAIAGLMSSLSAARDSAGAGAGAGVRPNTSHSPPGMESTVVDTTPKSAPPSTDYRHGSENGGTGADGASSDGGRGRGAVESKEGASRAPETSSSAPFPLPLPTPPVMSRAPFLPNRGSASAMKKQLLDSAFEEANVKFKDAADKPVHFSPMLMGTLESEFTSSASGHAMGGFRQARESSYLDHLRLKAGTVWEEGENEDEYDETEDDGVEEEQEDYPEVGEGGEGSSNNDHGKEGPLPVVTTTYRVVIAVGGGEDVRLLGPVIAALRMRAAKLTADDNKRRGTRRNDGGTTSFPTEKKRRGDNLDSSPLAALRGGGGEDEDDDDDDDAAAVEEEVRRVRCAVRVKIKVVVGRGAERWLSRAFIADAACWASVAMACERRLLYTPSQSASSSSASSLSRGEGSRPAEVQFFRPEDDWNCEPASSSSSSRPLRRSSSSSSSAATDAPLLGKPLHARLCRWADLLLVLPLDAPTLADFAAGHPSSASGGGGCDGCLVPRLWRCWNAARPALVGVGLSPEEAQSPYTGDQLRRVRRLFPSSFRLLSGNGFGGGGGGGGGITNNNDDEDGPDEESVKRPERSDAGKLVLQEGKAVAQQKDQGELREPMDQTLRPSKRAEIIAAQVFAALEESRPRVAEVVRQQCQRRRRRRLRQQQQQQQPQQPQQQWAAGTGHGGDASVRHAAREGAHNSRAFGAPGLRLRVLKEDGEGSDAERPPPDEADEVKLHSQAHLAPSNIAPQLQHGTTTASAMGSPSGLFSAAFLRSLGIGGSEEAPLTPSPSADGQKHQKTKLKLPNQKPGHCD